MVPIHDVHGFLGGAIGLKSLLSVVGGRKCFVTGSVSASEVGCNSVVHEPTQYSSEAHECFV